MPAPERLEDIYKENKLTAEYAKNKGYDSVVISRYYYYIFIAVSAYMKQELNRLGYNKKKLDDNIKDYLKANNLQAFGTHKQCFVCFGDVMNKLSSGCWDKQDQSDLDTLRDWRNQFEYHKYPESTDVQDFILTVQSIEQKLIQLKVIIP